MTALFAAILAVSAFLVFWVQPLVAKMLLPILGGTPSVWNTCILFFQGMLLLGYLYSHWLTRASLLTQGVVHGLVFALAIALLPGQPGLWVPPQTGSTALWVLARLLVYLGLPFAILSSSAPLLQHWFGCAGRPGSRDPYFLYAASNAGSFLALMAFPIFLERLFTLPEQMLIWRWSYVLLAIGILTCFGLTHRNHRHHQPTYPIAVERPSKRILTTWVVLSFVPSSLMLGVTTHITTDIAAVSYLWVLPLGLYLATFVIAFSRYGATAEKICRTALPLAALAAVALILENGRASMLLVPVELAIVSFVSLIIHSRLYQARPPRSDLTLFYLWIAFGGFLGGLFNGLLAPLLFPDVIEYPLMLMLGVLIAEWPILQQLLQILRTARWNGLRLGDSLAAVVFSILFAIWLLRADDLLKTALVAVLISVSAVACSYAVGARAAGRLVVLLCFLSYPVISVTQIFDPGLHTKRSFFGTIRIHDSNDGGVNLRLLFHGTTVHGIQARDPTLPVAAQGYYKTPADVFARYLENRGPASIAVAGLGAGTLACAGRAGDLVTFFEIDPAVERVAREYFTYLERCPPGNSVVIGDARQTLARAGNNAFDILVIDTFSSDSVPVHLLTDEAVQMYERILKDDGLLAFHISNRYLDLRPVLGILASHRGWQAWELSENNESKDPLILRSNFVYLSKSNLLQPLLENVNGATLLASPPNFRIWTDDYSNPFAVLRW